ncbi:hypothetical protein DMUE_5560 [Dictyocoela muelleri]|nr:hypothetical protein DMUE_5560 [Dictyocoela muelleri]
MRNLKISTSLINTLKNRIEDKIMKFSKNELTLGGDYVTVEIDESLIASAKYGKERYPKQIWVLGVVERESGKCYIQVVPDRSRKTLEAIIKNIVLPATIIISDKANAYDNLSNIGFKHYNVNHSENFMDPITCAHTQTFERLWNIFEKKSILIMGLRKKE